MNYHFALSIILLFACLVSLIEVSQAMDSSERDAIYRTLSDFENPIGSEETRALLRKLYEDSRSDHLSSLIKLADLSEERCDNESWLNMIKWKVYDDDDTNLDSYVIDCFRKQFIQCLPKFEQKLRSAIELLDEKDRKQLMVINDIFIKPNGPKVNEQEKIYDSNWIKNFPHIGSSLLQLDSISPDKKPRLTMEKLKDKLAGDASIIKKQLDSVYESCRTLINPIMVPAIRPFEANEVYPYVHSVFPKIALELIPTYDFCLKFYMRFPRAQTEKKKLIEDIVINHRSEKRSEKN